MKNNILVINPGSTSTKIAVYQNDEMVFDETIRHSNEELEKFATIPEQKNYRYEQVANALKKHNYKLSDINAVAARGGIIKPISGGVYEINDAMFKDLTESKASMHASCLAGIIGYELAKEYNIKAYIVNPVVVDEMSEVAKISGIPQIERYPVWHALNQKEIARQCAHDLNKSYQECKFIVSHMGGGITVAAHHLGQVIDVNNGIDGDGPFSPERCGGLPVRQVLNLIKSGECTFEEVESFTNKKGGLVAYCNTNDLRVVEEMIANNDKKAKLVFDAMAYQVAKEIGAMAAVLKGDVDAIILTGGLSYSKDFVKEITNYVKFIADVKVYAGENEIEALVQGVLSVMNNEEQPKIYK